eukprot:gb/GECG01011305.1/.p1 GENE.gb/GECG01011305.1/~~gb/GECG01011305.1/.p1  ORF type:complete len:213 (+),score=21.32 gb/GECG01011305.1/:1-639(+)
MAHRVSANTIANYSSRFDSYEKMTKNRDVSEAYSFFTSRLPEKHTTVHCHSILDLGCGPGRDLAKFAEMGYHVIGLDGCPEFCQLAEANSNSEVWKQDFLEMDLPHEYFHGVFSYASLFHVPKEYLSRVLSQIYKTLKPGGVLFTLNPNEEKEGEMGDGRYASVLSPTEERELYSKAGLKQIDQRMFPAYLPPQGPPWRGCLYRKVDGESGQ